MPKIVTCMENSYANCTIKSDITKKGEIYKNTFCSGDQPRQEVVDGKTLYLVELSNYLCSNLY